MNTKPHLANTLRILEASENRPKRRKSTMRQNGI
jgi:hypothetical protein